MAEAIPSPRILMGPGPSSVSPRVLAAVGRAPVGYLDPELFELLDALRADLRTLFGTSNDFTFPLTGTGMAAMECCLCNLVEPGDNVVVGVQGFFGGRMVEICRRLGATVTTVCAEWGRVLEAEAFAEALQQVGKVKLVACVHAETSTGVCQPLDAIAQLAHAHDALFLVDMVTSLGGMAVNVDACGVDVAYSGTQKCLGAPPGLAPVTVSERAWQVASARHSPVSVWYFDWQLLRGYYDAPHTYHHTVPVNLLFGLQEALCEILEEGLAVRFERHQRVSDALIAGLQAMEVFPFAQEGYRLPTLNAVRVPEHIRDEVAVRRRLLQEFGIEIGGGLGELRGKIWRIGTMGASATHRNVVLLLSALQSVMRTSS
ncbi:MAG: alanine--glyoxylate aminotransferase family protein [Chloroherpetonaceae bacterium]|nr:alanine--glyoxylate aminotransferase family protein [Chthonomonadaceae bacterium]MDW8208222.1 alanine--glyoxylate aminotransferase family protein [Chloroherpetonaceae bacterium]